MKSKLWVLTISSAALVSGCGVPRECIWTDTLYYESDNVVDWLAEHDPDLLTGVTSHNEKRAEFCR